MLPNWFMKHFNLFIDFSFFFLFFRIRRCAKASMNFKMDR